MRTPLAPRAVSRIEPTEVRMSWPLAVTTRIWSAGSVAFSPVSTAGSESGRSRCTAAAKTTLPLRSPVSMERTPLPPRL